MTKAIFVSNRNYLSATGGGVQWCTRDYLDTLAAAGMQVQVVAYDNDQRPATRFRRKVSPRPFVDLINPNVAAEIESARRTHKARWIFLNNSEPLALAAGLKRLAGPETGIVYFSHGVESTDQINELRLAGQLVPAYRRKPAWIGRMFLAELALRERLDGVVCLSHEDVLFERWLGSENACFLPRSVRPDPLACQPVPGRLGTVATLSHIPNVDGIRRFAVELSRFPSAHLRLVGGPPEVGEKLAREFPSLKYVGFLSDGELKAEAATWCAFVNPIFCQARGVSTKVATALGWGLPVLTTPQGARGYRWDDAALPRVPTAGELAELACRVATRDDGIEWHARAAVVARLAPNWTEAGEILREFLRQIANGRPDQRACSTPETVARPLQRAAGESESC